MPAPMLLLVILSRQVETGPNIALVIMEGSQMIGRLTILGTWSMLVPIPWDIRPLMPFSLKEPTAKPTILAQQPIAAAPAASPSSFNIMQRAALEMGAVRAMPTTTEIITPIMKGCISVAELIKLPRPVITALTPGAAKFGHQSARKYGAERNQKYIQLGFSRI